MGGGLWPHRPSRKTKSIITVMASKVSVEDERETLIGWSGGKIIQVSPVPPEEARQQEENHRRHLKEIKRNGGVTVRGMREVYKRTGIPVNL